MARAASPGRLNSPPRQRSTHSVPSIVAHPLPAGVLSRRPRSPCRARPSTRPSRPHTAPAAQPAPQRAPRASWPLRHAGQPYGCTARAAAGLWRRGAAGRRWRRPGGRPGPRLRAYEQARPPASAGKAVAERNQAHQQHARWGVRSGGGGRPQRAQTRIAPVNYCALTARLIAPAATPRGQLREQGTHDGAVSLVLLVRSDLALSRAELAQQAARTVLAIFKKAYKGHNPNLRVWEEGGSHIKVCAACVADAPARRPHGRGPAQRPRGRCAGPECPLHSLLPDAAFWVHCGLPMHRGAPNAAGAGHQQPERHALAAGSCSRASAADAHVCERPHNQATQLHGAGARACRHAGADHWAFAGAGELTHSLRIVNAWCRPRPSILASAARSLQLPHNSQFADWHSSGRGNHAGLAAAVTALLLLPPCEKNAATPCRTRCTSSATRFFRTANATDAVKATSAATLCGGLRSTLPRELLRWMGGGRAAVGCRSEDRKSMEVACCKPPPPSRYNSRPALSTPEEQK